MKFRFASCLLLVASFSYADVNFKLALVRNGFVNIGSAVPLALGQPPAKVYQDTLSYIEAELLSEKDDNPHIQFTVATKNETGNFIVRGMPQAVMVIGDGIGMSSVQCDSKNESFTLIFAVSHIR